jgi:hypothetical protein
MSVDALRGTKKVDHITLSSAAAKTLRCSCPHGQSITISSASTPNSASKRPPMFRRRSASHKPGQLTVRPGVRRSRPLREANHDAEVVDTGRRVVRAADNETRSKVRSSMVMTLPKASSSCLPFAKADLFRRNLIVHGGLRPLVREEPRFGLVVTAHAGIQASPQAHYTAPAPQSPQ